MIVAIGYRENSTVTAEVRLGAVDAENEFDRAISACDSALSFFEQSKPGSVWGSDGVGHVAQQRIGVAVRHKSGVGPRKFKAGLAAFQASQRESAVQA